MTGVRGLNSCRVEGDRGPAVHALKEEGRGGGYWKLLWDFFFFCFVFLPPLVYLLLREAGFRLKVLSFC